MIVGSIKENITLEKRVSITPESAKNIIALGLKVYIEKGNTYKGTEWYYDGYNWNQAQQKTKSNQAPLYNLYDNNKVLLSDSSIYSSSDLILADKELIENEIIKQFKEINIEIIPNKNDNLVFEIDSFELISV